MTSQTEQAWVGFFVLVASALLVLAVLSMAGVFRGGKIPHRAYFKFGGGLESGAVVRFGGIKAGSVQQVRVDPADSTQIEVDFGVRRDIPLKVDSVAEITSIGILGDNYLEISTGTRGAALASPGSVIKSAEATSFTDLSDMAAQLEPMATEVLLKLNERLDQLQVTLASTNDLLNRRNRANISTSLGTVASMLAEDRPKLGATLDNFQTASARLAPLLNDSKRTMAQANDLLSHIDGVVLENRPDLRGSIIELRRTLITASSLLNQLNGTLDYNAGNIDQILQNLRMTTLHLRELTEEVKRRPYTLIRANNPPERRPGER
jgi:phospholipid/cholesterol/gamma-HCH transport system substrate-binding protein